MNKYTYYVTKNILRTPTVRSIVLRRGESSQPFLFEPGQYAAISLHNQFRPSAYRCFSIASSPHERNYLEFSVRIGGNFTRALEQLRPGDKVSVKGPFGHFVLDAEKHQSLVLFAGGIGITPFMSMLRYTTALSLQLNIHLVYSCRSSADIAYREELTILERQNPNLRITYVLNTPDAWSECQPRVIIGRLDRDTLRMLRPDYKNASFMICGPGGYLSSLEQLLREENVPYDHILTESFSQGSRHSESSFIRWPSNTYALSIFSLMLAGMFVVGTDVAKTLPKIEANYDPIEPDTPWHLTVEQSDMETAIQAIDPQVDTNLKPTPVERHVTVSDVVYVDSLAFTPKPKATPTVPATEQVVAPAPKPVVDTPSPVPTTKAKTRARTRTS